jgi:hypothetical protein
MYGGGRSLSGNVNENKNSMFKIHLNNELANVVYHYDLICFVQDQYGKQDWYCVRSMKRQSTNKCCTLCNESAKINIIGWFDINIDQTHYY